MLALPETLRHLRDDQLLAALRSELTADKLPLERHLTSGGWPESPQIAVRGIRDEADFAIVLLTVEFIEQVPAACPASARPETRIAYLKVRIRKLDALAEILDD